MQVAVVQIQLTTTQATPDSQILALGTGERSSPISDCAIRIIHFTIQANSKKSPPRAKNISPTPVHFFPALNEPHPGNVTFSMTQDQARSRLIRILGITRLGDQEKYGLAFPSPVMAQIPNIKPSIHPQHGVMHGTIARMAAV